MSMSIPIERFPEHKASYRIVREATPLFWTKGVTADCPNLVHRVLVRPPPVLRSFVGAGPRSCIELREKEHLRYGPTTREEMEEWEIDEYSLTIICGSSGIRVGDFGGS
jgi:hypothetical protein